MILYNDCVIIEDSQEHLIDSETMDVDDDSQEQVRDSNESHESPKARSNELVRKDDRNTNFTVRENPFNIRGQRERNFERVNAQDHKNKFSPQVNVH